MQTDKKKHEHWMQAKWRPAMGWMYMIVCIFDFILFPIFWAIIQFWEVQAANDAFRQWQPITLMGAGLFHMAMGAVLGVAAWSRGQEKMQMMNTPNIQQPNMPQPDYYEQRAIYKNASSSQEADTSSLAVKKPNIRRPE